MPFHADSFCEDCFPIVKKDRLGRLIEDQGRVTGERNVICRQDLIHTVAGTEHGDRQLFQTVFRLNLSLDPAIGSGEPQADPRQSPDHTVSSAAVFRQGKLLLSAAPPIVPAVRMR